MITFNLEKLQAKINIITNEKIGQVLPSDHFPKHPISHTYRTFLRKKPEREKSSSNYMLLGLSHKDFHLLLIKKSKGFIKNSVCTIRVVATSLRKNTQLKIFELGSAILNRFLSNFSSRYSKNCPPRHFLCKRKR